MSDKNTTKGLRLKRYAPDTIPHRTSTVPCIHVSPAGTFGFGNTTADLLKVTAGDGMWLFQDEANPEEWYVAKCAKPADGFTVRQRKDSRGTVRTWFQNMRSARTLLECIEDGASGGTMLLAIEPVKQDGMLLFPILTSSFSRRAGRAKK